MRNPANDLRQAQSTRGRIIALLRQGVRTVQEIAADLGVSGGAVRVHLTNLERDGIVQLGPAQKGFRKPFQTYELTEDAEHALSRAYPPVLAVLVTLLGEKMSGEELDALLCETGRELAARHGEVAHGSAEERTKNAVNKLNSLGGSARIEEDGERLLIHTSVCPLRALTGTHPKACQVATCMLSELIGAEVRSECEHSKGPRCRFLVDKKSVK